jgi:hypothetical protein
VDEIGDATPHQLGGGLGGHPPHARGIDINDASVLVHTNRVGAMVNQTAVAQLGQLGDRPCSVARWTRRLVGSTEVGRVALRCQTLGSLCCCQPHPYPMLPNDRERYPVKRKLPNRQYDVDHHFGW